MKETKDYGLLIAALVAIVAIVGLVILLRGDTTGTVVVIRGEPSGSFDRPLGNSQELPCWYSETGAMICPGIESSDGTFGQESEVEAPAYWGAPSPYYSG